MSVKLSRLSKPFSAYEQKLLAADALKREKIRIESQGYSTAPNPAGETRDNSATLISVSNGPEVIEETLLSPIRLSAGYRHLKSVKLMAEKRLGAAIVKYYKSNPEFLWLNSNGQPTGRATAVLEVLCECRRIWP